jgi:hypothetical protein
MAIPDDNASLLQTSAEEEEEDVGGWAFFEPDVASPPPSHPLRGSRMWGDSFLDRELQALSIFNVHTFPSLF